MPHLQPINTSKKGNAWQNRSENAQKSDFTTLAYGKIPPQAREMETAVLGACMMEKGAFDLLTGMLQPECFYVEAHKTVFEAMRQLSADIPLNKNLSIQRFTDPVITDAKEKDDVPF